MEFRVHTFQQKCSDLYMKRFALFQVLYFSEQFSLKKSKWQIVLSAIFKLETIYERKYT